MVCVPGKGPHHASKFGVSVLCSAFVRTRMADSARNRAERYGPRTEVPAAAAQFAALVNSGREPDEVAEKVMRAIKENELYIFVDPQYRSVLAERFQRIVAAFPPS